jgi:Rrf2 family protein
MILKNQVEWALHCCAVMAALPEGKRVSTKALSQFHGVPKEYLSKALQAVSQAGLVEGTLGPKGGYRLARNAADISFLDIVEAVEGRRNTFNCTEIRGNNPCLEDQQKPAKPCAIARIMWQADEAWRDKLRAVSLLDLQDTLVRDVPADQLQKSADWLLSQ